MTPQIDEPNQFILQGVGKHKDVHINYSTTSITGKPIFNYKDSKCERNFTGDEIRTQETEIDTMVTVTLEAIPDVHILMLTLLVPAIRLEGAAREFKTIAIRTVSQSPFAGTLIIKGALQSYEVIDLKGTADSVVS